MQKASFWSVQQYTGQEHRLGEKTLKRGLDVWDDSDMEEAQGSQNVKQSSSLMGLSTKRSWGWGLENPKVM